MKENSTSESFGIFGDWGPSCGNMVSQQDFCGDLYSVLLAVVSGLTGQEV